MAFLLFIKFFDLIELIYNNYGCQTHNFFSYSYEYYTPYVKLPVAENFEADKWLCEGSAFGKGDVPSQRRKHLLTL